MESESYIEKQQDTDIKFHNRALRIGYSKIVLTGFYKKERFY